MTPFKRQKKTPVRVNEAPARSAKGLRLPRVAILAGVAYLALVVWEGTEAPRAVFAREAMPPTMAAPAAALHLPAFAADAAAAERGVASWYGRDFQGRPTASGEAFDMHGLTAAHRTLPFGTPVEVTNPGNGRRVVVRVNDRGPHARNRLIDLSYGAARELGIAARGTAPVELRVLR
ncbi:MAG TPA: septal ring lytic transglycosylase RlpA family protein [Thermoanaerobaculia bacterium]|nr:septal ring lytic transglycosylase RlpA family protein [Thermoanaerobaculia bacterium]